MHMLVMSLHLACHANSLAYIAVNLQLRVTLSWYWAAQFEPDMEHAQVPLITCIFTAQKLLLILRHLLAHVWSCQQTREAIGHATKSMQHDRLL